MTPLQTFIIGLAALALATGAGAFEVGRNVNTDEQVDKLILFEKGQGLDRLEIQTTGDGGAELTEDGALRLTFRGNQEVLVSVGWKAEDGLPEALDMDDYQALFLRCRMEGHVMVTPRRGGEPKREELSDRCTIGAMLVDGNGARTWGGRLTSFAPGEKAPRDMTDIAIHLNLLNVPQDAVTSDIRSIQFRMAPRGRLDRDYSLILEKISLTQ